MKTRTRRILAAINDSMAVTHDCEAATRSITTALSASFDIPLALMDLIEQYAVLKFTHRRLAALRSLTSNIIADTDDRARDLHRNAVHAQQDHSSAVHEWMCSAHDALVTALEALPD